MRAHLHTPTTAHHAPSHPSISIPTSVQVSKDKQLEICDGRITRFRRGFWIFSTDRREPQKILKFLLFPKCYRKQWQREQSKRKSERGREERRVHKQRRDMDPYTQTKTVSIKIRESAVGGSLAWNGLDLTLAGKSIVEVIDINRGRGREGRWTSPTKK